MDKDFMLNYYDKMVRPIWTELMKTPRYQRAACEHDKLEREFRRLLDEKLGRKYLELDDALFRVMDDIAEAMYEQLADDKLYHALLQKKIAAENTLRSLISEEAWKRYLDLDAVCNELEGIRLEAMYLTGAVDYERFFK